MPPDADSYPVYGEQVYEQPIGYPDGGDIILESGNANVYSRTINYTLFCRNASQVIVSEDINFAGATWVSFTRTGSIVVTSDGSKTIYAKFRNPGHSEGSTASDTILVNATPSDKWTDILDNIGSKVMSYYNTYKVESSQPNIQRYYVGEPNDPTTSDKLPILWVGMDGVSIEQTDGTHRCGTFQRFQVSLHIATLDDVNEQAYKAKNQELIRCLQSVARVIYNKRTLDGVVNRITSRRAEKTSLSDGEGRKVITGRLVTEVLFTNTSV